MCVWQRPSDEAIVRLYYRHVIDELYRLGQPDAWDSLRPEETLTVAAAEGMWANVHTVDDAGVVIQRVAAHANWLPHGEDVTHEGTVYCRFWPFTCVDSLPSMYNFELRHDTLTGAIIARVVHVA
jgi:hypothetical protein